MKIETYTNDDGRTRYMLTLEGTENVEFQDILDGWLDALEYHEYKSRGYKKRDVFSLGIKGEFVGFWRKAQKLLPLIWESKTLTGEGTQEVLMDTFGSVGLMLQALRKTSDKYSASWRDNHGNKPTFGPGPRNIEPMVVGPGRIVEIDSPPDDAWMRSLPNHDAG
jgi:hypothetical protein